MKTILVVDDSRIMRNIVKNTFATLNIPCDFVEAEDGETALKVLIEQKIDLVLLDWNMPKLSGIEFLEKVRAVEKYKNLPIVMVTSEAAKFNVIQAHKMGVTDYIIKPFSEKLFMEKLSGITF